MESDIRHESHEDGRPSAGGARRFRRWAQLTGVLALVASASGTGCASPVEERVSTSAQPVVGSESSVCVEEEATSLRAQNVAETSVCAEGDECSSCPAEPPLPDVVATTATEQADTLAQLSSQQGNEGGGGGLAPATVHALGFATPNPAAQQCVLDAFRRFPPMLRQRRTFNPLCRWELVDDNLGPRATQLAFCASIQLLGCIGARNLCATLPGPSLIPCSVASPRALCYSTIGMFCGP